MNGDDSFNDSDEVSTLYSSKKTTQAFRAQFHKLLSSYSSDNGVIGTQTEDACKEIPIKSSSSHEENKEKNNTSAEIILDDNSIDNSIEIIEETRTRRGSRQSQRLRNKKQKTTLETSNCSDILSPVRVPVRRRKSMTRKRGKKKKVDEVLLENSQESGDNIDEDELNPEVSVKVIWKSVTIKKFMIRKFQKMSKIFEDLSKEENIPQEQVLLTFNNVRVKADDTPDSLKLQVYHFLDGGVLFESKMSSDLADSKVSDPSENSISLKFQDANKKILKILIHKDEKIKVAMIKCSEQLEVPLDKIKFFFDGEPLKSSETPFALGIENDEIIDIKIDI